MKKSIFTAIALIYATLVFSQDLIPEADVMRHFFSDTTVQRVFHFDRFDSLKVVDCNFFMGDHELDSLSKPKFKIVRNTDLSLSIRTLRGDRFRKEQDKWTGTIWLQYAIKCGRIIRISIYLGEWNMYGEVTYIQKKGKLQRVNMSYGNY